MSAKDRQLVVDRVADAFRTRLGLSDWKRVDEFGPDNSHPSFGYRYLFHTRSGSAELARHGIYSLTLGIALPRTVFADIIVQGGHVSLIVRPDRVSVEVDMEPFGGLVYKSLTESEIAEMIREWEPFRLVIEAIKDAGMQLKAEIQEGQE